MMRKASCSKKKKVNLTDILKWNAINEKEKAKLQETAQRKFGVLFHEEKRTCNYARLVA